MLKNHPGARIHIWRASGERYLRLAESELKPGDKLDMGIYSHHMPGANENIVEICFADGMRYIETKGAIVRIWL
jgi:hypothetical protein